MEKYKHSTKENVKDNVIKDSMKESQYNARVNFSFLLTHTKSNGQQHKLAVHRANTKRRITRLGR